MVNSPRIIGADLALTHGAIVDAQGEIIYTYHGLGGMNSTIESIYARSREAALTLPEKCIVVIDWDRTISSWGKKKRNGNIGTLLTLVVYGFSIVAREMRQAQVHFVAPSAVRECLGLPATASKDDVHKAVYSIIPQNLRKPKFHSDKDVREDCWDAFLLASTYFCARDK